MEKLKFVCEVYAVYITLAIFFIILVKEMIQSNKDKWIKFILLSVSNFINYLFLLYCYRFVTWTIEFEKFQRYPYKNPFCIFVFICCIIIFIIFGTYYIKHHKNTYGIKETVLLFISTHILAILYLILLRVPLFLGLTGIY